MEQLHGVKYMTVELSHEDEFERELSNNYYVLN